MHKTRLFLPPISSYSPGSYDLLHPRLRFVSLPRESVKTTYDFEGLTLPTLKLASVQAGKDLIVEADRIVIPVHELQLVHIQDKFLHAYIYPEEFSLPLLAQQSLRYSTNHSVEYASRTDFMVLGPLLYQMHTMAFISNWGWE